MKEMFITIGYYILVFIVMSFLSYLVFASISSFIMLTNHFNVFNWTIECRQAFLAIDIFLSMIFIIITSFARI